MVLQIRHAFHAMFGQCAAQANEQHCVIQRVRKFDPKSFAETFILAFLQNPDARSAEIASMATNCDVPMSVQAIDKRFTQVAADFFQTVFTLSTKLVVHAEQSRAPILDRFTAVHVIDGSSISLPDSQEKVYKGRGGSHASGKSALKLQTEIDLKTGALECVDIAQGCDADVACARQSVLTQKGALRITDLGYFRIAVFIAIANMNAWFLSRIQRTTLVHFAGKSICDLRCLAPVCSSRGPGKPNNWLLQNTLCRLPTRQFLFSYNGLPHTSCAPRLGVTDRPERRYLSDGQ